MTTPTQGTVPETSLKGAWFGSRDPFCMRNCGLRKTATTRR